MTRTKQAHFEAATLALAAEDTFCMREIISEVKWATHQNVWRIVDKLPPVDDVHHIDVSEPM